jgi:hypothetical protein
MTLTQKTQMGGMEAAGSGGCDGELGNGVTSASEDIVEWNGWKLGGDGEWVLDTEFALSWIKNKLAYELDGSIDEQWEAVGHLYPWDEPPNEKDLRKAARRMRR